MSTRGPESALLLERRISLEPGQRRASHFLYGYLPKGFEVSSLVQKYQRESRGLWAQSSNKWKKSGMHLGTPSVPWAEREVTWSHY